VTRDQLIAAARHAAALKGLFPDGERAAPEVLYGPEAATVLTPQQGCDAWIVCIHPNHTTDGDWYVTGDLPHGSARIAAATYAQKGMP
jgi:hypothetical protein